VPILLEDLLGRGQVCSRTQTESNLLGMSHALLADAGEERER
jgi:hypothetical protein